MTYIDMFYVNINYKELKIKMIFSILLILIDLESTKIKHLIKKFDYSRYRDYRKWVRILSVCGR